MKRILTIILIIIAITTVASYRFDLIPLNPTFRTPVNGFAPKVVQDRDLRAVKSLWIPYTNSTTPDVTTIDTVGSNFKLLNNGNLAVSKGLGTGFWQYPPSSVLATTYQTIANLQTNLVSSSTNYPNVDAVNTGLALKANLAGGNIFTGIQEFGNGTLANPPIQVGVQSAPLGLYRVTTNSLGITAAGTRLGYFERQSTGARLAMGQFSTTTTAALNPPFTFDGFTNYGMYLHNSTTLGFTIGGISTMTLTATTLQAPQYKLSALNTAPASATATGTLGEIRITATFIYVCTATNTWVRTALTTW